MANVQDLMDTIPVRKFEAKWLKKREKWAKIDTETPIFEIVA